MNLKDSIRTIPDWPHAGIQFRDITSLLQDRAAFRYSCDLLTEHYRAKNPDKIAGIDARGFIFAAVLADRLDCGLVLIRKPNKLPAATISQAYQLEYGTSQLEIHQDAVQAGENFVVIDDLLATGGTAAASCNLLTKLGGKILGCGFVIELPDLGGRKNLAAYDVFSLVQFAGE